jgi:hypothetical protein
MPVTKRKSFDRRANDNTYQELKKALIAEWRDQPSPYQYPKPEIIEEEDQSGRIESVYVVWDALAKLDDQTRSELIVEAFREVKGEDKIGDLMLAMGLTSNERARFSL